MRNGAKKFRAFIFILGGVELILLVFCVLYVLSWLIVIYGHSTRIDAFAIAGFAVMFLLNMVFLTNNLEVQQGQVETLVNNVTTITPTYAVYSNHTIAFLLTIVSAVGIIAVMVDRRTK